MFKVKDNNYFYVRTEARNLGIPRTTMYDRLNRLVDKKLINKPEIGRPYVINKKGEAYINNTSGGVGFSRKGCRTGGENLSMHKIKYKGIICRKNINFSKSTLKKLHPIDIKENKLPNLLQYFIYFDDATITINPKKVIVHIHDVVDSEIENVQYEAFTKAMNYFKKLDDIGLSVDNVILEDAHYARINGVLAECLKKIDERYSLDLGNGKSFWIDNSTGTIEDETNSEEVRERMDDLITDLPNSDYVLSDIGKIESRVNSLVKISENLIKIQTAQLTSQLQPDKNIDNNINKELMTYVG